MKKLILTIGIAITSLLVLAQNVQPSMMVLPYTKSGESALDLFENDIKYRAIVNSIEKAFIDRGAELIDLESSVQNARLAMTEEANAYSSIQDALAKTAGAEVVAEAEIDIYDDGNSLFYSILLKAKEPSTGNILYAGGMNTSPPAPKNAPPAVIVSGMMAYQGYGDNFLNGMQAGFTKIVEQGRGIKVVILTDDRSEFLLDDDFNDDFDLISDEIIKWVKMNSMNNVYRLKSQSGNRLEFDQVKIPLRKDGLPYAIQDFCADFSRAIGKICKQASETMGDGLRPKRPEYTFVNGKATIYMPSAR